MSTLQQVGPGRRIGCSAKRVIRDVSSVLIISGLLLLLDAGVTLVWQEPVTVVIGLIESTWAMVHPAKA